MHEFQSRGSYVPAGILVPEGRFGRMFPKLDARIATGDATAFPLGQAMGPMDSGATPGDESHDAPSLPAGFTFLGQFLDHDLDFDPTSSLERQADPNGITNFRTPALDLDNVYGAGPMATPYIYDSGGELLLLDSTNNDLARNPQYKALIGDPRNDENMIISQLEFAFMSCHNSIVAGLKSGIYSDASGNPATTNTDTTGGESTVFLAAQQLLRWHYQWMIINEFLPAICGEEVVEDVLKNGPSFYQPSNRQQPYIPVEFSVAAYRFGHPTVRAFYDINAANLGVPIFPTNPAAASPTYTTRTDLRGGPVGKSFNIEWKRFFNLDSAHPPQKAKRIEPLLNTRLLDLPNGVVPPNVAPVQRRSLATRNLLRSEALMVPSGQDVARALGVNVLKAAELQSIATNAGSKGSLVLTPAQLDDCYLWYYLLAEAFNDSGGDRLGAAGARIVAEVFVGVIDADGMSYRHVPEMETNLARRAAGHLHHRRPSEARRRGMSVPARGSLTDDRSRGDRMAPAVPLGLRPDGHRPVAEGGGTTSVRWLRRRGTVIAGG